MIRGRFLPSLSQVEFLNDSWLRSKVEVRDQPGLGLRSVEDADRIRRCRMIAESRMVSVTYYAVEGS